MRSDTAASRAACSSGVRLGPGSLSLVVVPSGSMTAMFIRVPPAMGTAWYAVPEVASNSSSRCPSGPPDGSSAMLSPPLAVRARATLIPLPPGSIRLLVARLTSPTSMRSIDTVRSMLGLGGSVTIMRG